MQKKINPEIIFQIYLTIRMFHFELAIKDYFNRDQREYINKLRRLWMGEDVPYIK